ncbi:hypothetical protein G7Y89_g7251 [Cudoniella acicularis]|uniref:DUF1688 domain-containing protein n=1 Tax=Cudoniella acicularis TaxID=354080 RepID=A0A8H4W4R3_9HELO|nr:hypothetical protein G7Y89_g7251 [Cudoniella acicularis]
MVAQSLGFLGETYGAPVKPVPASRACPFIAVPLSNITFREQETHPHRCQKQPSGTPPSIPRGFLGFIIQRWATQIRGDRGRGRSGPATQKRTCWPSEAFSNFPIKIGLPGLDPVPLRGNAAPAANKARRCSSAAVQPGALVGGEKPGFPTIPPGSERSIGKFAACGGYQRGSRGHLLHVTSLVDLPSVGNFSADPTLFLLYFDLTSRTFRCQNATATATATATRTKHLPQHAGTAQLIALATAEQPLGIPCVALSHRHGRHSARQSGSGSQLPAPRQSSPAKFLIDWRPATITALDKSGSTTSGSTRKNSSNLGDIQSMSSQSSLKSPTTPSYKMSFSVPPTIPKIALPKAPDPYVDPAGYLRSIGAVRERCSLMLNKAQRNELNHFDVHMENFKDTTKFVVSIIKRDFAPDYASIPPHGRWQHFNVGGKDRIAELQASWRSDIDPSERCRRLLDLFLVSVLLDAGAGTTWSYKSTENGRIYRRSEGLAIASLEMFKSGIFSSNSSQPYQVDGEGLRNLTVETMRAGLQVTEENPIAGLEGRTELLIKLSEAMMNHTYFGADGRPGNMLDYLISHPTTQASSVPFILLPTLWSVLMDGLAPIWPSSRTAIDGTALGDAWPLSSMPTMPSSAPWETIVPFHKLTQWLCYSLMQPMTKLMNIHFAGAELMTGLPEYRNGGLFIDTGVLALKDEDTRRGVQNFKLDSEKSGKKTLEIVPMFEPDDDVIVEWRAVTVGFLDLLLEEVNKTLGLQGVDKLSLPQMLEAGSWKRCFETGELGFEKLEAVADQMSNGEAVKQDTLH